MKILSAIMEIVRKNLLLMYRSKVSSLIIILGPLLIILTAGSAFNSSELHGIHISVFSEKYNNVSEELIASIERTSFLLEREHDLDTCIRSVKESKSHLCIHFPEDLDPENNNTRITYYVDYSRTNLVANIWQVMQGQLINKSTEIGEEAVETLIDKLNRTASEIDRHKKTLADIEERIRAVNSDVSMIDNDINSMDYEFSSDEISINDLKSNVDRSIEYVEDIENSIDRLYKRLERNYNSIEEKRIMLERQYSIQCANPINQSESCPAILLQADSLKSQAKEMQDYLEVVNSSREQLDSIASISASAKANLNSIEEDIEKTQSRFDEVSKTRARAAERVSEIKAVIDENLNSLEDISESLVKLGDDINEISSEDPKSVVSPIKSRIKPVIEEKNYLYYLFPSLVILVVMFMSVLLSSTMVVSEKESKAFNRNMILPLSDLIFFLGAYGAIILVVFIQILIVMILGSLGLNIDLPEGSFLGIIVSTLFIASVFILVGMIIGNLFNSEETATIASISVGCIFFLFSSTVLPLEKMSPEISRISRFNPFILGEVILKRLFFYNSWIAESRPEAITLMVYIAVLIPVLLYAQKTAKERNGS